MCWKERAGLELGTPGYSSEAAARVLSDVDKLLALWGIPVSPSVISGAGVGLGWFPNSI